VSNDGRPSVEKPSALAILGLAPNDNSQLTFRLLPRPGRAESEVYCVIWTTVSIGLLERGFKVGDVIRIEAVR
jgi:hypothetical protein